MAVIVADTDVLIDFLMGSDSGARAVGIELRTGNLHTTAINRFEVLSGARTKKQLLAITTLLSALKTLPLDEAAADQAAGIRRALESKGASIGMADSLIAGITVFHGGHLLTRNRRHFERISGLTLVDLKPSSSQDRVLS